MTHQLTLTDDEYAALAADAARRGQPVEDVVRELLAARYPALAGQPQPSSDPLIAYMLRMGHLRELPTGGQETPAEAAERERLARSVAPGQPASDMVIEDRGPRG